MAANEVTRPRRWPIRLIAVIVLLLCLGGGFAAGMIADRIYLVTHGRLLPTGGLDFVTRHLVHKLDRALDLTDEQEVQVRQILDRRRQRILSEWSGVHDRFHAEIDQAHGEIATVLTPEQREKFERMQKHWRGKKRWRS